MREDEARRTTPHTACCVSFHGIRGFKAVYLSSFGVTTFLTAVKEMTQSLCHRRESVYGIEQCDESKRLLFKNGTLAGYDRKNDSLKKLLQ